MHQRSQEEIIRRFFTASAAMVILAITAIVVFVGRQGLLTLREVSPVEFFFSTRWNPWEGQFGAAVFIIGSLATTLLAILFGGPVGVGVAIFMSHIAPQRIRHLVRQAVDLFVGIPSVVYGWIGLQIFIPLIREVTGSPSGFGLLAASLVLSIMILPTVISLSEDALRSVPRFLEEGSLALGATRWQTISRVLVPAAMPGILTAIILAMGRAIGETMAVQMLIGNTPLLPRSLVTPTATLTSEIVVEMASTPFGSTWNNALFLMALVLLLLSLGGILMVRLVLRRKT